MSRRVMPLQANQQVPCLEVTFSDPEEEAYYGWLQARKRQMLLSPARSLLPSLQPTKVSQGRGKEQERGPSWVKGRFWQLG